MKKYIIILLLLLPLISFSQEVWSSISRYQVENNGVLRAIMYFDDTGYATFKESETAALEKIKSKLLPGDIVKHGPVILKTFVDRKDENYVYWGTATLTVAGGKRGVTKLNVKLDCEYSKRREIGKALYDDMLAKVIHGEYLYDVMYITLRYCKK